MRPLLILAALGALLIAIGVVLMRSAAASSSAEQAIDVLCAAGLRKPLEAAVTAYARHSDIAVRLAFGGSGDLESRLAIVPHGDLYIPADQSFIDRLHSRGQISERIALATQAPVLAVPRGNPRRIATLADAIRGDLRFGLANPESASIGRLVRDRLGAGWPALHARITVTKPTVNDIAADLAAGALDAAILWDATVQQFPALEAVPLPELGPTREVIAAGVLTWTAQPQAAQDFARFLASDEGAAIFRSFGYAAVDARLP